MTMSTEAARTSSDRSPADELVQVGFIFRPHGVRGELKVNPETSSPDQFERFEQVWVGPNESAVSPYVPTSVRYQQTKRGTTVILQLDGVDSRESAEAITKQSLFVPADALDVDEDELMLHNLVDLEVVSVEGVRIGTVEDVLEHPAHITLTIRCTDGREAMIPFVADFVRDVDLDAGRLEVTPIEGLLDDVRPDDAGPDDVRPEEPPVDAAAPDASENA